MKAVKWVMPLVLAAVAMGGETQPATRPGAVDYSSPRGVMRSYLQLVLAGDLDALDKCCVAGANEREREIVRCVTAGENFMLALGRAAAERFGEEKAKEWLGGMVKQQQIQGVVGDYKEEVKGDEGKLVPPSADAAGGNVRLKEVAARRVNGQWRLVVPIRDVTDEVLKRAKARREMVETMCKEIRAGKYATFEEASKAYQEGSQAVNGTQPRA